MKRPPNAVPMSPAMLAATVKALESGGVPQALENCPSCVTLKQQNAKLRGKVKGLEAEIKQMRMAALGTAHLLHELRGGKGSD